MYLKSLTLSGFKSFGKATLFEFPTPITGIVGPNGSGKSNVVEAIRWVLGEQSIKSLRGKKGEDLIFNGSEKAPRMGRAEVKLIFDNSHKQFPFEFEDVIISRRVMRDGANEYALNGSLVRLKDIYELLAKVGLGATQHHVISQGEVDRILYASLLERQEMIEEALSLKEFRLKARDAERKLAETDVNIRQIEAQRREIQPHLKYLKAQADKMKATEVYMRDIASKSLEYAEREKASLIEAQRVFEEEKTPLLKAKKEHEDVIKDLSQNIKKEEHEFTRVPGRMDASREIDALEERRRILDRELGKIEGLLLVSEESEKKDIPLGAFVQNLQEAIAQVDALMQKDSFESLKSGLKDVKGRLEDIMRLLGREHNDSADAKLTSQKEACFSELKIIEIKIRDLKSKKEEDEAIREDIMIDLRSQEQRLREEERKLEVTCAQLRAIEFAEERLTLRRNEFEKFLQDAHITDGNIGEGEQFRDDHERMILARSIDRLRIKLEEAGGIDEAVIREYDDTLTRDAFLMRELEDVRAARETLSALMRELEEKLKEKFSEGLVAISEEFRSIFKSVFGGGKASLAYIRPRKRELLDGSFEEEPGGVDISIDIPRKRLRSLDMLSGGERALASVALLFAISSVNPPPFLVLDETDAALDEANSQRYGDLLENLCKKTQLVVITHNRETMRRCGVLYGVTQGNDAISRVLSVKFEEAEELAGVK